jgi:hypothetical protein
VTLVKENSSVNKTVVQGVERSAEEPPAQFFNIIKQNSVEEERMVREREASEGGTTFVQESSSSANASAKSSGDEGAALLLAKHWGPERLVEVHREPNKSLGISIVGGKVRSSANVH